MCGIVGMILLDKTPQKSHWTSVQKGCLMNLGKTAGIMRDMLWIDGLRGHDGTGYLQADNIYKGDPIVKCYKKNLNAVDFLENTKTGDMLNNIADYRFHIGHNRYSTKGASTSKNSHPFHEGNIWMVHNGSITNILGMNDFHKFDVDSEAACAYMKREGVEKFAKNVIGAYAVVWFDELDSSLHILRNEDRQIYYAETEHYAAFASEPWTIQSAVCRNGHKILKTVEIKAGVHYQFDYFTNTGLKVEEQVLEVYKAPEPSKNNYHQQKQTKYQGSTKADTTKNYATSEEILSILDLKFNSPFPFIPCEREKYTTSKDTYSLCSEEVINGVEVTVRSTTMSKEESDKYVGECVTAEVFSAYYDAGKKKIFVMVRKLELMDEVQCQLFDATYGETQDSKPELTAEEVITAFLDAKNKPANTIVNQVVGMHNYVNYERCDVCGITQNKANLKPVEDYKSKNVCTSCLDITKYNQPKQSDKIISSMEYHNQSHAIN